MMQPALVFSKQRRSIVSLIACMLALLVINGASAHVGVLPGEAAPNTNQTFTVRVPNEQDAPTVEVRIEFPANLTVSRFQPKPGWQREAEQDSSGRIIAVTWSGGQINAGEYDDFTFIARTPAETGPLSFKAYQTYQGGEVVEWINGEGQDRPAPVVTVQAAAAASGAAGANVEHGAPATTAEAAPSVAAAPAGSSAATADASTGAATNAGAADAGGSDLPLFASLGALVIALIALALSGVAVFGRRHPA